MKHFVLMTLTGCVQFPAVLKRKRPFPQPCCTTPPAQVEWKFYMHIFGILIHLEHPFLTYLNSLASLRTSFSLTPTLKAIGRTPLAPVICPTDCTHYILPYIVYYLV